MNLSEILSNKFIKIVVAAFFFVFVYKIIYQIGIFFGWNEFVLDTYMMWLAILVLLVVILPIQKSFL
jgi:hypothetical protein